MDDLITITILSPWPELASVASFDINPRVVACSYATGPGGFTTASVGLLSDDDDYDGDYPFLPEPVEVPEDAHVEFRLGGSVVYTGAVTHVALNRRGFVCEGYGLWATLWGAVEKGGDERVQSDVMLREALHVMRGWILPGDVPEIKVMHAWDEVVDRPPGVVIQQLCAESGHAFVVYEDNVGHIISLTPKAVPDIVLGYARETVQVGWEYKRAEAVKVVYRDRDGSRRETPIRYRPDVVPGKWPLKLEVISGNATPDGADALALTRIAEQRDIKLSGDAMFSGRRFLNVRYGDTFQLGEGLGIISGTRVDLFARTVALTLGQPSRMSPRGFLNDLARIADASFNSFDAATLARTI